MASIPDDNAEMKRILAGLQLGSGSSTEGVLARRAARTTARSIGLSGGGSKGRNEKAENATRSTGPDVDVALLGLATVPSGVSGWWQREKARRKMKSAMPRVFAQATLTRDAASCTSPGTSHIRNAKSVRDLLISEAENADKEAVRRRDMLTEGMVVSVCQHLLRRQGVWTTCGETTGAETAVLQQALTAIYQLADGGALRVDEFKTVIEGRFKESIVRDVRKKINGALDCVININLREESVAEGQPWEEAIDHVIRLFKEATKGKVGDWADIQSGLDPRYLGRISRFVELRFGQNGLESVLRAIVEALEMEALSESDVMDIVEEERQRWYALKYRARRESKNQTRRGWGGWGGSGDSSGGNGAGCGGGAGCGAGCGG